MINLVEEIAMLFTNSDVVYAVVDRGYDTVFYYDYDGANGYYRRHISVMNGCISISYDHKDVKDVKREIADVKGGA